MKTQTFFSCLLGLMLLGSTIQANGGETPEKPTALSIQKQLLEVVTCPSFLHYQGATAEIILQFHVENDFTVVVENMIGDNQFLKHHLSKELMRNKILVNRDQVGKSFSIKLTYR